MKKYPEHVPFASHEEVHTYSVENVLFVRISTTKLCPYLDDVQEYNNVAKYRCHVHELVDVHNGGLLLNRICWIIHCLMIPTKSESARRLNRRFRANNAVWATT